MASVLCEIAPETEIYALNVVCSDEDQKVEALIRVIDWLIQNKLDVLTYSSATFSESEGVGKADLQIFHYDYNTLFVEKYLEYQQSNNKNLDGG